MKYKVVVFGVKDTSENIIRFIHETICPVDLIVTIDNKSALDLANSLNKLIS